MTAASGGKLTASFTLSFNNLVSPEVAKLFKQLKELGALTKSLGFDKLKDGSDQLRDVGKQAGDVTRGLGKVGSAALDATRDLGRLGSAGVTDLSKVARQASEAARSLDAVRRQGLGAMGSGGVPLFRPGMTPFVPNVAGAVQSNTRLARMGRGIGGAYGRGRAWLGGMHEDFGAIESAAAGIAVMEPLRRYADLENTIRHIAITEKLSGAAVAPEIDRIMSFLQSDALGTGQNTRGLATAYTDLLTLGLSSQTVERLLPIHSRAATAYNINPDFMGHAVGALSTSFKISETDMGGALAAMATAAKEGRFKVEDFSRYLPMLGGRADKLGMTGRGFFDMMAAGLETTMKYSADPSTGAANYGDLMQYITSGAANHAGMMRGQGISPEIKRIIEQSHALKRGTYGIDWPRLLLDAERMHIDPLSAFIDKLAAIVKGQTPVAQGNRVKECVTNCGSAESMTILDSHCGDDHGRHGNGRRGARRSGCLSEALRRFA